MDFRPPSEAKQWLVLVDAGGSKTAAALATADSAGKVVICARGNAGPGNPVTAGWDTACRHWQEAIAAAVQTTGETAQWMERISGVVLAAAGTGRPQAAEAALRWCTASFPGAASVVVPDVAAILAAGSPEGVGVALVAGTGSLAWGIDRSGQVARCGGWGFFLGDQGGGAWIGHEALRAVVKAADRRESASLLTTKVFAYAGVASASDLVTWSESSWRNPSTIAALAPVVIECAKAGDKAAIGILNRACHHLAELARCVAIKLGEREAVSALALGGGLFVHYPVFRKKVWKKLKRDGWPSRPVLVKDPLEGAARIAENLLLADRWSHWRFAAVHRPTA